jgi:hypothetical protein
VVVDNKPGAGGNIGADNVAKSPPDGYSLVMGTVGTHSINGALYSKMPYDMVKDFTPVAHVASAPNLLVVTNDLPVKNVAELITYLKANPNKLSFGSPGIGTSVHVSGELFKSLTGTSMQHVPYKGRQFAIPDLVGGQIQVMFDNMPSALPMAKEGKIRALAQTTAKRSPAAPDVPTVAETVPGFEATTWFAVFAPAGTPATSWPGQRRDQARLFAARGAGQAQDPGPGAVDLHARGAGPLPGRRDHQVGQGGEGLGREGGLTSPPTTSHHTLKDSSVFGPKVLDSATSQASRPRAISTRPMRGVLLRASKVYQRSPSQASNQPRSPSCPRAAACRSRPGSRCSSAPGCSCSGTARWPGGRSRGTRPGLPGRPPRPCACGARVHSRSDVLVHEVADGLHAGPAGGAHCRSAARRSPLSRSVSQ